MAQNKEEEIKKCLFILNRLRLSMADLQGLNLGGIDSQLLQGSYTHLDQVKAALNALLGRELEPSEYEEDLEVRIVSKRKPISLRR
jgi:hypothetical protein